MRPESGGAPAGILTGHLDGQFPDFVEDAGASRTPSQGGPLPSVHVERGSTWTAGTPTKLIDGQYYFGGGGPVPRTYDVSPDGQKFLMIKEARPAGDAPPPPQLVVVQNWLEELKRLVPTNR